MVLNKNNQLIISKTKTKKGGFLPLITLLPMLAAAATTLAAGTGSALNIKHLIQGKGISVQQLNDIIPGILLGLNGLSDGSNINLGALAPILSSLGLLTSGIMANKKGKGMVVKGGSARKKTSSRRRSLSKRGSSVKKSSSKRKSIHKKRGSSLVQLKRGSSIKRKSIHKKGSSLVQLKRGSSMKKHSSSKKKTHSKKKGSSLTSMHRGRSLMFMEGRGMHVSGTPIRARYL